MYNWYIVLSASYTQGVNNWEENALQTMHKWWHHMMAAAASCDKKNEKPLLILWTVYSQFWHNWPVTSRVRLMSRAYCRAFSSQLFTSWSHLLVNMYCIISGSSFACRTDCPTYHITRSPQKMRASPPCLPHPGKTCRTTYKPISTRVTPHQVNWCLFFSLWTLLDCVIDYNEEY